MISAGQTQGENKIISKNMISEILLVLGNIKSLTNRLLIHVFVEGLHLPIFLTIILDINFNVEFRSNPAEPNTILRTFKFLKSKQPYPWKTRSLHA
jgi:hypothetical protein